MIETAAASAPGPASPADDGSPDAPAPAAGAGSAAPAAGSGFSVRLEEFEGPFDLLLSLIAKHRLDVTVLALHTVIDDFLAHIRRHGPDWDLDEATEFLVVASTLLDLKAARLLPSGEVEDEEDLALLEARDLLFARLLQYRAYKEVSGVFAEMIASGGRRHPRQVGLDPEFAGLLPEVLLGLGPEEFASLAGRALAPRPVAAVSVSHIHAVRVSVREQAAVLVDRLRRHPSSTFRGLIADCDSTLLVVARFLALLELYREGSVAFDQLSPLGELHVRWTGSAEGEVEVAAEEYDGAPQAAPAPEPDAPQATADDVAAYLEALGTGMDQDTPDTPDIPGVSHAVSGAAGGGTTDEAEEHG
ncbi:MAG: segregation/condensation protein A [Frankiales bacterium]|nr:segregation/condensation protein A [Frankiales bacterium]